MTRPLPIVGGVLEHNIGDARAQSFKEELRKGMCETAKRLCSRLAYLDQTTALRVLLHIYALLTGLGQIAYPAAAARRVIAQPGFEMFRVDLVCELSSATSALLRGVEAEQQSAVRPKVRGRSG